MLPSPMPVSDDLGTNWVIPMSAPLDQQIRVLNPDIGALDSEIGVLEE